MKMWKPFGVTVQGTKNNEIGVACQDVLAVYSKNGISVIAMSTGGNKTHSEEAANIVAPAICKYVANNFVRLYSSEDDLLSKKSILDDLENRLSKKAKKYSCDIEELAASICFVGVKEDKHCIIGQIGNGLICDNSNGVYNVVKKDNQVATQSDFVTDANVFATMSLVKKEINDITSFVILSNGAEEGFVRKQRDLTPIMYMGNWINEEDENTVIESIVNNIETRAQQETAEDCGIIYLAKVEQKTIYDKLDYEQKTSIFEKHYSHLYNVEAAIEDASFIIKLLKTTDANVQYISKRSKVSLASCKKITSILHKANYLFLVDDVYSVVRVEDVNE